MGPLTSASLVFVAALLQGATARPYSEERQLLDRHLIQLSRALPDAPTPDNDAALLKQIASEAGLRNIEVGPPTITEMGSLGQSRRVITATSTYPDADRFFRALQGSQRLVEVESLILRGAEFGVSIESRVRLYHRASRAPLTSLSTTRMRDRTRGATREEALRFMRDEQIVLEKTIALDDLRRRQTSPRMFLAETGSSFRDAVAALTFASLDGDTGRFTLHGVVAGLGAADALERRIEGGFFRLREFSRTPQGGCYQFEVVGESFRAGPEASLPLPVDEPFRPTEPLCRMDRDAPGALNVTLRAQGSAPAGLSLRTIDADLADVAAMIEALSRQPLVVAEEVRGRVHVDFAGASVDEALKALPVRVDPVGAVRLLRSPEAPPLESPAAEPAEAPPVGGFSLRAKRVLGEDVLAALAETEPAYVALGPKLLAKLSVFARDAPIEDIRRAALAALRLEEMVDENGARVLKFREGALDPAPITATSSGRVVFRPRDLMVDEVSLAGIGRSTTEYVAFAYSPLGEIVALRAGEALADGVIASLDANAMLIDTSEGPVRISLATVPPRQ